MYPIDDIGHILLKRAEECHSGNEILVRLKGHDKKVNRWTEWYDYDPLTSETYPWGEARPLQPEFTVRSITGGRFSPYNVNWVRHGKILRWFEEHADGILQAFISQTHGSLEKAMAETLHFSILFTELHTWWRMQEEKFMEKFELDMAKVQEVTGKFNKQSMGAAANLCKTLTKTMEKQGADIGSIAKVQYAICTQAGIYIPDEFLKDVAVALTTV